MVMKGRVLTAILVSTFAAVAHAATLTGGVPDRQSQCESLPPAETRETIHGSSVSPLRTSPPPCDDYVLDSALIERLYNEDPAALPPLEARFALTFSLREQNRIAAALLGKVADDSLYFEVLKADAMNFIRLAMDHGRPDDDLLAWCEGLGYDPSDYYFIASEAFRAVSGDRRMRWSLMHALDTENPDLATLAIEGLISQKDDELLPVIDQALGRLPVRSRWVAALLSSHRSAAADAIAIKYLPEWETEAYRRRSIE